MPNSPLVTHHPVHDPVPVLGVLAHPNLGRQRKQPAVRHQSR
jgi:hypothetical protein